MNLAKLAVLLKMVDELADALDTLDAGPGIDEDDDVHFDNRDAVMGAARRLCDYRRANP